MDRDELELEGPIAQQDAPLTLFPERERDASSVHTTGIFPSQRLRTLIDDGAIFADEPIGSSQIQPASLDLRLGAIAHEVKASFLPAGIPVARHLGVLAVGQHDLRGGFVLKKGTVYLIPLMEHVRLPADLMAKANPKSTTGRLDVFTRLIVDGGTEFERIPNGYRGPLYAEVAPRSFDVVVRPGDSLNQLRIIRGTPPPSDRGLSVLHEDEPIVYADGGEAAEPRISKGLWISVDLADDAPGAVIGYRARPDGPPIDLREIGNYDAAVAWDRIAATPEQELILEPGRFYVLASRERISVPPTHAAEMVNYDPSVGEFRIHYAGFFDPGFGHGARNGDTPGARAVLEVRPHEVPFVLRHGQHVGRLVYERLTEIPDKIYGRDIGSSYQRQGLRLSKQFRID